MIQDIKLRIALRQLGYNPDKFKIIGMDFESYTFREIATGKKLALYR